MGSQLMKAFTIPQLAGMIRKDWDNINANIEPYLVAMEQFDDAKDNKEVIVLHFLCNAIAWRGNLAETIKKELNRRVMET